MTNDAYVFGNILEWLHRWGIQILVAFFMRFLFSHSRKAPRFYGLFHYHSSVNVPRLTGEMCTTEMLDVQYVSFCVRSIRLGEPLQLPAGAGWWHNGSKRGAACVKICGKASSLPYQPTITQKTQKKPTKGGLEGVCVNHPFFTYMFIIIRGA